LIRLLWCIGNKWHWLRNTLLGEDSHSYNHPTEAAVFSFQRIVVMNLLRHVGYRSILQGLRDLACDIKVMLVLCSITTDQGTA
jgi:hypothetical protein